MRSNPRPPQRHALPLPAAGTAPALIDPVDVIGHGCNFPGPLPEASTEEIRVPVGGRSLPFTLVWPPDSAWVGQPGYTLLIHAHGARPIAKLLATRRLPLIVATFDAGDSSGDYDLFAVPADAERLLADLHAVIVARAGTQALHLGHLLLSSWSAGFRALPPLLTNERLRGVVLLDSLYAPYQTGRVVDLRAIGPFVQAAERAADRQLVFFSSATEIRTHGYASTEEVAASLAAHLDAPLRSAAVESAGAHKSRADRGDFSTVVHVGDGRDAHCDQLRLLPDVLERRVLPARARHEPPD